MELRYFKSELRAESSGKQKKLRGVAIRYGTRSASYIATGTRERIASGAFSKSIRSASGSMDIRMLYEHNAENLLARTSAGTLRLTDTDDALLFDADLPDTTVANDLYEQVRVGNVRGMSFGMIVDGDDYATEADEDDNGNEIDDRCMVRTVRSGSLIEISSVSLPAYETGTVLARNSFQLVSPEVRSAALAFHKHDGTAEAARRMNNFLL
ncbi:MAG TPA: HK97 family phage prohead protease [Candidatus Acidoferrum sp.]|nr:HK97 family phage prohead protease [Candidatus Acidoferrum sp.]